MPLSTELADVGVPAEDDEDGVDEEDDVAVAAEDDDNEAKDELEILDELLETLDELLPSLLLTEGCVSSSLLDDA